MSTDKYPSITTCLFSHQMKAIVYLFIYCINLHLFIYNCCIFSIPFRWNGYNVEDYKKVVEEYTKLEMVII